MKGSVAGHCPRCEFQNADTAGYCVACGEPLHARCAFCHAQVQRHHKYCGGCGRQLIATVDLPGLARTVSRAPDGEWKIATILFADIAGSTALIGDHDAEDARGILKPTIDKMIEIVRRYDGVIREQGDGIMASFGVPAALEDHAVRACYSALDIQEAMRIHADMVRLEFGALFQVRIGINSGPVVVTGNHQDLRVDGMPIHIAKRIEGITTPGKIFITHHTLGLAKGFISVAALGSVPLKDVAEQVKVYELQGINARMRIHARAARGLSNFVGRRDEIGRLNTAAALVQSGRGQGVALVGEAGVGKSRILLEFARSLHREGWLILEASAVSYGKETSYRPLVDLLSHYFEISRRDDQQQAHENIAKKLIALGEEKLLAQIPLFVGALGLGVRDSAWTSMTPLERQHQLFAAIKRLLVREAERQPVCAIFEDLHWIDSETHTFVEMLLDSIPVARALVLVNHRPDYENRWTSRSYFSLLRIDPLPTADVDELLRELLGADAELGPIKQALIDLTQGNPLFIEESVQSLIESGVINKSSGQWRPVGGIPTEFIPRTIESLLAERIDRLPPDLKELLQCAAVIGNDVEHALLEPVTGFAAPELERGLHALQKRELLSQKVLFPARYVFKHSMTREVAYASLLRDRRAILHARTAQALELLAGGRLDEQVDRLAEHAERGHLWEKALDYLQRAGAKSYFMYANVGAVGYFERALKVLRRLPETRANRELDVDLHFELRNALLPQGETDRILESLKEIEPVVAALDDKQRSARYAAFRCNHHFLAGEQRRAIEFGEAGLQFARACGDKPVEGELLYRLGQSYNALGEFRRAISLLEKSLEFTLDEHERSRFDLTVIPSVVNRAWLTNSLIEIGEFAAAMRHAKRSLEIAEKAEHPLSQVLGWLSIGHVLSLRGELEGAVGALERGLGLCDQWSLRVWRPRVASILGVAYARTSCVEEGLQLTDEAVSAAERMGLVVDRSRLLVRLGQASLIAGKVREAVTLAKQAIEFAQAHEANADEGWARFLLARASQVLDAGNMDEAIEQANAALRLALKCDARPLAARCWQALGLFHELCGNTANAAELAASASNSYAQLGMRPLPGNPVLAHNSAMS
jgi:class 3 adenylate cyclase/tetratricopeptide (TPR) repeat protein